MKKFMLIYALIISGLAKAQNIAINNNGTAPHASAMLDITSTNKGILIPRLSTQQRTAIVSPATGLLVFDSNTNSFWFFSGSWKEISTGGAGGSSFQLPYNETNSSANKLFGITNTSAAAGSSAVYGKSSAAGSGVVPAATSGVWGDNSTGIGVIGTASSGQGVYGLSFNNNGDEGYSVLAGKAAVYGSHANDGGIGIMGEMQNNGTAVYGKATGINGKAGVFESLASHSDTTLKLLTAGLGPLSTYYVSNPSSINPAVDINHEGNGNALKIKLVKANATTNAIDVLSLGTGAGIYSKSENGIAAKLEISNPANTYPVMMIGTKGGGSALHINSQNTGLTGPVIDVLNQGEGQGLAVASFGIYNKNVQLQSYNLNNFESNLYVEHNGKGRGIEVNLTGAANNNAGIYVNTSGNKAGEFLSSGSIGIAVTAAGNAAIGINSNTGQTANNAIGVKGTTGANVSNGTGVLGQAGINDLTGIGVKGTGAVGVYGETAGADGIGIAGTVASNGTHSLAALFTNKYAANGKPVVQLNSNGKGIAIFSDNTNNANASDMLHIRNAGTGNFLKFSATGNDIVTIKKNGDITTDGLITVKGNQGIVTNTGAYQLRTQIFQADYSIPITGYLDFQNGAVYTIDVDFPVPFTSPPVVYVGNLIGSASNTLLASGLVATILDVTATGCKLKLTNTKDHTVRIYNHSWKLVALGGD